MKRDIRRFYEGKLSEEEEVFLMQKINSSGYWKAIFLEYEKENVNEIIDSSASRNSWANYQNRYKKKSLRKHLIPRIVKYAAIFLFGIFSSVSVWFCYKQSSTIQKDNPHKGFTLMVPRGDKAKLMLPDGSEVWLNAESKLTYNSEFGSTNRIVSLSGEGLFKVAKNNMIPFKVYTKDCITEVHGTVFDVNAYPEMNYTQVALKSGSVWIKDKATSDEDCIAVLVPGQMIQYNNESSEKTISSIADSNVFNWRDNVFSFQNITLDSLVFYMERRFDIEAEIKNNELKKIRYSGSFKKGEDVNVIMRVIQSTTPLKYSFRNNKLVIEKK